MKGDSFVPDKPRLWSEKRLANGTAGRNFDLAPDGKSVVSLLPGDGPEEARAQSHVTFLLNFLDEVQQRVSAGK